MIISVAHLQVVDFLVILHVVIASWLRGDHHHLLLFFGKDEALVLVTVFHSGRCCSSVNNITNKSVLLKACGLFLEQKLGLLVDRI